MLPSVAPVDTLPGTLWHQKVQCRACCGVGMHTTRPCTLWQLHCSPRYDTRRRCIVPSMARVSAPPHTRWRGQVHRRILWRMTGALWTTLWRWGAGRRPATHTGVLAGELPSTVWRWQAHCHAHYDAGRRTAMRTMALAVALPCALWRWKTHCRAPWAAGKRIAIHCGIGRRIAARAAAQESTVQCTLWCW